ncbi:MAG TPA: hypothetical protein VGL83_00810 [Stellaceae bacterium]|jgi:hypothetical protein
MALGTGAVIGIAIVCALALTVRLLRRADAAPAGAGSWRAKIDPEGWPLRLTIVGAAIVFYTAVGILHQPPPSAPAAPTASEAPADADTAPAALDIGGVTLAFAPPSGSCLYPPPLLEAVRLQQAKLNPDNVIDGAFADCAELRNATASQTRLKDFGLLMTPKVDLDRRIDRAGIDVIAATMPDATSVKATLDQRLAAAQSQLGLQSFSALGSIDRDAQAIYFAYLSKAQGNSGAFNQACVMAMTAINGRLVSYYLYSDYDKDPRPVIFGLLAKAKAGVGDFAQRNPA